MTRGSLIVLGLLTGAATAAASGYTITSSVIAGGGDGFASAGVYSFGATTGQHDAGTLSGGGYSLVGGFWVVDTPEPVELFSFEID